uniref:Uncharacterized protein n=1 Tax=Oryza brachyantha TaxID=4533 RepID=J3N529_ORYBR
MAVWRVLLMALALICALHASSVHGGDRGGGPPPPPPRPNTTDAPPPSAILQVQPHHNRTQLGYLSTVSVSKYIDVCSF